MVFDEEFRVKMWDCRSIMCLTDTVSTFTGIVFQKNSNLPRVNELFYTCLLCRIDDFLSLLNFIVRDRLCAKNTTGTCSKAYRYYLITFSLHAITYQQISSLIPQPSLHLYQFEPIPLHVLLVLELSSTVYYV